jgi:hypothetical protein
MDVFLRSGRFYMCVWNSIMHHIYVWTWIQKRKREFPQTTTSRNQYDNSAELSEINKTAQHGRVKTVKGKTKKQRGIRGDKSSSGPTSIFMIISLSPVKEPFRTFVSTLREPSEFQKIQLKVDRCVIGFFIMI